MRKIKCVEHYGFEPWELVDDMSYDMDNCSMLDEEEFACHDASTVPGAGGNVLGAGGCHVLGAGPGEGTPASTRQTGAALQENQQDAPLAPPPSKATTASTKGRTVRHVWAKLGSTQCYRCMRCWEAVANASEVNIRAEEPCQGMLAPCFRSIPIETRHEVHACTLEGSGALILVCKTCGVYSTARDPQARRLRAPGALAAECDGAPQGERARAVQAALRRGHHPQDSQRKARWFVASFLLGEEVMRWLRAIEEADKAGRGEDANFIAQRARGIEV